MPPVFDRRALPVDRNPLNQLSHDPGKLPRLDPAALWSQWLDGFQQFTGLNLRGPVEFVESVIGVLGNIFGAVVTNSAELTTWIGTNVFNAISALGSVMNQIGDVFNGLVVVPISSAVANIADWFRGLLGWREETETTQINLQNFQITAQTTGSRNPGWVFRYPVGDVTYPEVNNADFTVFGTTGAASTGTAHTHELAGDNVKAGPNVWAINTGDARGGMITVQNTTIYDTVCVAARKANSADTLNNVFLEVFRENVDGSTVLIHSADVSSQITTTSARFIEAEFVGAIAQAGERFMVRLRNASTSGAAIYVSGVLQYSWPADASAFFDNSAESNKTTYTAAEMAAHLAAGNPLPWAGLAAKNLAPTPRSVSDDFNRSALGSMWSCASNTGSQLGITGNRMSFKGTTDGHQNGIHIMPMIGDANRAEGDITLDGGGGNREVGFLIHCSRDMSQVVFLAVAGTYSRICSGPIGALVERASVPTGGGGKWAIYYDEDTDTYTALKNGATIGLEWANAGAAVKHGRDYRYGGGRITRSAFFNAGQIDNFTLRDWAPGVSLGALADAAVAVDNT